VIAQRVRFTAAIIVAGFVYACSGPGGPSLSPGKALLAVSEPHSDRVIKIHSGIVPGVAVDPNTHDVYFSTGSAIQKLAPNGTITDSSNHAVYFTGRKSICLNGCPENVYKLAANGTAATFFTGNSELDLYGVAVDSHTHTIYLGDRLDTGRLENGGGIVKLAPDGTFLGCVSGQSPSQNELKFCRHSGLSIPHGVAVDPSGLTSWVYASDIDSEIKRVDNKGVVTVIGGGPVFHEPFGVAVDKTRDVFVADSGHNEVKEIFGPCSCIHGHWTFLRPFAVAVDVGTGGGTIRSDFYVADLAGLWKVTH
jgi:DNA-binding beta-propeller fold protein YncE